MDVRMPDGVIVRGVPDDITQEELLRRYKLYAAENRTIGGYAREALKAVPRGLVGGLEQAALGAAALLPGDTEGGFEKTAREGIKGFAERLKPKAAVGYEEAIPTKLFEAVGSFGSLLGPAGIGSMAARGLGLAAGVGRTAAVAPTAAAMGAGEARERAVEAGATPEQITSATQAGIIPGIAELASVGSVFRLLPKELTGTIFNRLQRMFVTGGIEGLQEGASAVAQNLIAQQIYKPSQELIEKVGENAAYGAGAGAIVQFLVDAVAGRRAKPAGAPAPTEQPPAEPTAPAVVEQPVAPAPRTKAQDLQAKLADAKAQYDALAVDDPARIELAGEIAKYDDQLSKLDMKRAYLPASWYPEDGEKPYRLKESALATEQPDLFGMMYPQAEPAVEEVARPEFELTGEQQAELFPEEPVQPSQEPTTSKVTDATLLGIGLKPGTIKTAKFAKELKTLDLSNPQDIEKFEELVEDYGRKSTAKQPYNQAAVKRLVSAAKFRLAKQTSFDFGEGVPDATGPATGGGGVDVSVSQPAAGGPAAAGTETGGVAATEGPAAPAAGREGQPVSPLSDVEEVETALDIAAAAKSQTDAKSKKDFNDAITYLSYFKNSPDVGPSAKKAAIDALDELGVPAAEVQAAWENISISEAAAQQEQSEDAALKASEKAQRNIADQERRAKQAETRAARATLKKPVTAKEKAQYASAEKRMTLKAPVDVPFQTAEDANALLETYLTDIEKGDPALRKRTKNKDQLPAREFVDKEDRENIARLMREGKFDDAHTAIFTTVQRAVTAAKASKYAKEFIRASKSFQLSHRPVGSGLSKDVTALLQKGDLKGALRLLGETGSNPIIRTAARKILSAIKNTKVQVRETPTGDAGIYSPTTDTIYIDPKGLHEHTLLHEAMHAAVSHVLANPNHPLTKKLQKLFDALSPEIRGQYGATNLQEFAAESISNQDFQDILRGQPKNWWGRFVDAVRGFFGLSKASQVEKTLNQLLEAAPSEARQEGIGVLKLTATAAMDAQATRRIAEKKREGDQGFFQQAWNFAFDPEYRANKVEEFRNSAVFNGAALEKKMLEKNQLRSVVNLLLATRSMDLATSSILGGAISLDKDTGLFKIDGGVSLADVHQEVQNIADKAGVSMEKAKAWFDLGATVLRMRSPKISPEIRKSMALSKEDEAAADDILAQFGNEIRAGVDKFQQYKNQLLRVGKETGRFTQEDVDEWTNAPEYVPWHRILDDAKFGYETKTSTKKYFKGLVDNGKVAELIGGDVNKRPIGDILGNMENLSFWLVNTIVRNHAANVAMDGLVKIDATALKTPQQGTPERLVKTYRDGEPAYFEVADPLDRHAFLGVETVTTPMFTALGKAANWLRTGTTLMPGFVVSQLFQDGFRATMMSGANRPFAVGAKVVGSFGDALMNKGTAQELAAYGIIGRPDFMSGVDRSRLEAALDKGGTGASRVRRAVVRALEAMSRASDAAQRIAVYEQTMKETGDKMLALYRASEIINFQRQGRSATINVLRQIIPFMNAYIQGMDVTYRAMFREGISGKDRTTAMRQFWGTGLKVAALASLYAILVSDDEEYKKLPDHEKLTGFMIPGSREMIKEMTGTDIGGNLKIPTPQDPVGLIFNTIPEQVWNYTMRLGTKDEVDATKLARIMKDGMLNAISPPGAMPQLIKPTVEVATNYSFFTGSPIIGKGLEGRSKDLQFTSGTTELAKALSAVTPLAPVQIDHLVRGYLGVFGGTLMYAGGRAIEATTGIERADRRWADVPQASTFLTSNAPAGLKDDYYELRQKSRAVAEDIKFLMERDPEEAKQRLMENKELFALAKSGFFTQVEQKLTQLRQARRIIDGNQEMSSAEKRERLDQIDKYEMLLFSNLNLPTLRKQVGM